MTATASTPPGRLLDGKTVVVTGAGGGVGRGIALACATHGANVVIAARRTETGDVVADEIVARGGAARSIRCDVAQRADVEAAVACAVDEFVAAILESSPLVMRIGKAAFYEQLGLAEPQAYRLAAETMTKNAVCRYAQEGISAFLGKRRPKWEGR